MNRIEGDDDKARRQAIDERTIRAVGNDLEDSSKDLEIRHSSADRRESLELLRALLPSREQTRR